jgi:hypothetical protein
MEVLAVVVALALFFAWIHDTAEIANADALKHCALGGRHTGEKDPARRELCLSVSGGIKGSHFRRPGREPLAFGSSSGHTTPAR